MNPTLHAALFKGYPIPDTFGVEPPLMDLETVRAKKIGSAREIILDTIKSLPSRFTSSEVVKASGGLLYINLVNRHLERLHEEKIVKPAGWASVTKLGGQRSRLWRLV